MNIALRLFLMAISALVFFFVTWTLVKKRLNESNSVMWFIIAFFTLISGFYPDITAWLSHLVGIEYPPALLFMMSIILLMMIIFKHSMESSKTETKINEIASTVAILKEENKTLKSKLDEASKIIDSFSQREGCLS